MSAGSMFHDEFPEEPVAIGEIVANRYEIIELLGAGGIARVYRGRHVELGLDAAVKIMHLDADRKIVQEIASRFRREAEIVASLHHPNIVGLHSHGFLGDARQPYLVMELLEGVDLQVYLERHGRMEARRAVPLIAACLDGIGLAHQHDVVHKDLKPANLFLVHPDTADERLVVLDFGGASTLWDARLTQAGEFMGTPHYLAPEYLRHHEVSPAVDVYQMGLVLARLVSGVHPVPDEMPLDCARRHLAGELVLDEALMSGPLGPTIACAVSLDPRQRFADGRAFAAALRALELPQNTGSSTAAGPPDDELDELSTMPMSAMTELGATPASPPLLPRQIVPMEIDSAVFKDWDLGDTADDEPVVRVAQAVFVEAESQSGTAVCNDELEDLLVETIPMEVLPREALPTEVSVPSEPVIASSAVTAQPAVRATTETSRPWRLSAPIPVFASSAETGWLSWLATVIAITGVVGCAVAVLLWLPHCS